jgi:hypothetical protein
VIRPYGRSTFVLVMADMQNTELVVSERQAKLLRERLPELQAVAVPSRAWGHIVAALDGH